MWMWNGTQCGMCTARYQHWTAVMPKNSRRHERCYILFCLSINKTDFFCVFYLILFNFFVSSFVCCYFESFNFRWLCCMTASGNGKSIWAAQFPRFMWYLNVDASDLSRIGNFVAIYFPVAERNIRILEAAIVQQNVKKVVIWLEKMHGFRWNGMVPH